MEEERNTVAGSRIGIYRYGAQCDHLLSRTQGYVASRIQTETVEVEKIRGIDIVELLPTEGYHQSFMGHSGIIPEVQKKTGVIAHVIRRGVTSRQIRVGRNHNGEILIYRGTTPAPGQTVLQKTCFECKAYFPTDLVACDSLE